MQLNISRKVSEANWNLLMREEIIARESVQHNLCTEEMTSYHPLIRPSYQTVEACCYCGQPHFPTSCSIITDIEARKQSLRKSGRCFSCLRKGHLSRNCRNANRCRACGGCHHTSIRRRDEAHPIATQPSAVSTVETTSSLNPSLPEFNPTSSV